MPNPSTAAAIAPRLALIVNLPSTWNDVAALPLRNDHWPPRLAGPRMIACRGKSAGVRGSAGLVEVSPRCRKDPRPGENFPHRRGRVGERTKPKRHVHAFGHEVFALVDHHQVDAQRRMPAHEVRKPGDDLPHRKGRRQPDPQYSAQLSRSARRMFRLIELGQHRLDARQEVQAGVGQRYRARVSDEERHADFALQRRDRSRRCRLRNVQLTTGRRKASLAGDPSEQPQREEAVAHSGRG